MNREDLCSSVPKSFVLQIGVLIFGARSESSAVLLAESDGERIRRVDIKPPVLLYVIHV